MTMRYLARMTYALAVLSGLLTVGISKSYASASDSMEFRIEEDTPRNRMMRFTINGGRYDIYASGLIDSEAPIRFRKFVKDNGIEQARVLFDSGGGSLIGGLKLGEAIRELGFETEVRSIDYEYDKGPIATCASACSYAFAGGISRFFDDQYGRLGLHQFYDDKNNVADVGQTQMISGMLVSYLDRMGINSRAFAIASMTDKSAMTWLTRADAEQIGLADNGISPTIAELKINEGMPYLKLEQNHHDVTARVLIMCDNERFSVMGGIVTTPEHSTEQLSFFGISYLEFDQTQYGRVSSSAGADAQGSVIWIDRNLDATGFGLLKKAETLGVWLENGGVMRWGAYLDLKPVRKQIDSFLLNCRRPD